MSVVHHPAPKLRLTALLDRNSGLTVAEALDGADHRLRDMVVPCSLALRAAQERLDIACRALFDEPGREQALGAAYKAAEEVLDLSTPAQQEAVGKAAYSLCELLDRYSTGAAVNRAAIQVHVDALYLLAKPALQSGGEAGRAAVLDGLAQVLRACQSGAEA